MKLILIVVSFSRPVSSCEQDDYRRRVRLSDQQAQTRRPQTALHPRGTARRERRTQNHQRGSGPP